MVGMVNLRYITSSNPANTVLANHPHRDAFNAHSNDKTVAMKELPPKVIQDPLYLCAKFLLVP